MRIYVGNGVLVSVVGEGSEGVRIRQVDASGDFVGDRVWTVPTVIFDKEYKLYEKPRVQTPPTEFQVGDVVILKSGGLEMVVYEIGLGMVVCAWMKPDGEIQKTSIKNELLTRVDDQQLQPVPLGTL